VSGQASDIQIHTREMLQLKANLYSLFRTHTGRTLPELESALDRDCFMSGAEAMAFGLIDTVVIPHKTAQAPAAPPAAAS
jgi:ATP-dependent Clp protease protease subunit